MVLELGFLGGARVKNLSANAGDSRDVGWFLGWKGPLGYEIAIHTSILAWRIPLAEERGRLP